MKKDYGWDNGNWLETHDYLFDAILRELDHNNTIIDIGCGNGAIARRLLSMGFSVYGVDADRTGVEIAQKALGDCYQKRFFCVDVVGGEKPFELKDVSFDVVISTEVIEHVYSPNEMMNYICKILNGRGNKLVISTPYHGYLKNLLISIFNMWDKHFTALWDGGHIKFFSKKTLTLLLEKHGFRVVRFYGCGRFPYLWKSMILVAVKK